VTAIIDAGKIEAFVRKSERAVDKRKRQWLRHDRIVAEIKTVGEKPSAGPRLET